MTYPVLDYATIKSNILRDISNNLDGAAVESDSDYAIRASGNAASTEGLYAHQSWIFKQIFPDLADLENLIRHAAERGIFRKPASLATGGAVLVTGTVGDPIPLGSELKTRSGIALINTVDAVIGVTGSASVPVNASVAGASGNLPVDTALTFTSAPAGINAAATMTVATTGGYDQESPASLLDRLLFYLRNPPQGGSQDDYKLWAREVAGVGYAYVYSQRRNARSVDIIILDDNGALPPPTLVDACQAYIDIKRNVTADCWVAGPMALDVPVTASLSLLSGYHLDDVRPIITAALQAYFNSLKPGDTVILKQIEKIIMSVEGVFDCMVTAPVGNVTALVDATHIQLATLGLVSLS